jgi:hypothetical protein
MSQLVGFVMDTQHVYYEVGEFLNISLNHFVLQMVKQFSLVHKHSKPLCQEGMNSNISLPFI